MSVAAAPVKERFRYEVDLVDALEPTFATSIFKRHDPDVETFREVPAARGVPDLSAVRFDRDRVAQRVEAGVRCLSTDIEVRAVLALRAKAMTITELAARIGMSKDYVRRAVVPLLLDLGWLDGAGEKLRLRPEARPVGRRVVTVEAKLRDWLRAFNQARHQQLSADAAYIALDSAHSRVALERLDGIAQRGIGVIVVDAATNRHRVAVRPQRILRSVDTAVGRMLVAERSLELHLRGERAGQVAPVFGWYPPERREQPAS